MDALGAYVGLDVHKDTISVAIADAIRNGEVRFWGTISNDGDQLEKLARRPSINGWNSSTRPDPAGTTSIGD